MRKKTTTIQEDYKYLKLNVIYRVKEDKLDTLTLEEFKDLNVLLTDSYVVESTKVKKCKFKLILGKVGKVYDDDTSTVQIYSTMNVPIDHMDMMELYLKLIHDMSTIMISEDPYDSKYKFHRLSATLHVINLIQTKYKDFLIKEEK